MGVRLTQLEFIKRANRVHGAKYDYSKAEYKNNRTKIIICCMKHGDFIQTPTAHIDRATGCPLCSGCQLVTTETFVERARHTHANKYAYKNVLYTSAHEKVSITCQVHGDFLQTPVQHISQKQGCPKCYGNARGDTGTFVLKATFAHNNTYNYSKVQYVSNDFKVIITCNTHGDFLQTPRNHLVNKAGCPYCAGRARLTTEQFISKATQIHGDTYNYSLVDYKNATTPIKIICQQHGEWTTKPTSHIHGKSGCPKCNSSKGEQIIKTLLTHHNINFIEQYNPKNLKDVRGRPTYRFDFFLLDLNTLIEFDGVQHDRPVERWNRHYTSFEKIQQRDDIKNKYAETNGIHLIRIKYKDINNIDIILLPIISQPVL